MGRDVTNLFIELIEKYKGIDRKEANKVMTELREKKQFLEMYGRSGVDASLRVALLLS